MSILRYAPWRVRYWAFYTYLKFKKVHFEHEVSFIGYMPCIRNEGTFLLGKWPLFEATRMPAFLLVAEGASLELGEGIYINEGVRIGARAKIKIGDNAKIGPFTEIMDSDQHMISPHSPCRTSPVTIGSNVWIATNCIILPGTKIGDNSVIGAGSVVRGEIPANCVAVGSPAKVIKTFDCEGKWLRT